MLAWRIYYGDGSTFSSADGAPSDAPSTNVQAIALEADPTIGRRISADSISIGMKMSGMAVICLVFLITYNVSVQVS